MLSKRKDPRVMKLVKDLEIKLHEVDCKKTNIGGSSFRIIRNLSGVWKWNKGYASICISGGLNGCGKWSDYLESINGAMKIIENMQSDSFIENIENDVTDDIFYFNVIIKL